MCRYRIRFNLGRGENYKKWQIKDLISKEVKHYDPELNQIELFGCTLHNNEKASLKIFNGANKYVCSWVIINNYRIVKNVPVLGLKQIFYNPRKNPHWFSNESLNIDGEYIEKIITTKDKLFVK